MLPLVVTPEIVAFRKEQDFFTFIENQAANTTTFTPNSAQDVCINDKHLTTNGFHYSTTALSQVCRLLCPGLWKVICETGGLFGLPDARNFELARKLFNQVVMARFQDKLDGREFVINDKTKTIDGVIGGAYVYISNHDLMEKLEAVLSSSGHVRFIESDLCGRKLVASYIWPEYNVKISKDKYKPGFQITNSETGECAVSIKPIWIREPVDKLITVPRSYKRFRLIHTGRDFYLKLQKLLMVSVREPSNADVHWFIDKATKLTMTKLDINVRNAETKTDRRRKVFGFLYRHGLPKEIASKIINGASRRSAFDDTPISPLEVLSESLDDRTYYDLFISLAKEAKNLTYSHRELADRAAFHLLNSIKKE